MIKFSQEKILLLHKLMAETTGGSVGVRDYGLLDSALESAYATFDNQELYPSKEEKGSRLGFSLISNHAFVDGNKRIGMYVMLTFLEVNGIKMACSDEDVTFAGLAVAAGKMNYENLLQWVREHRVEKE
ncbi:MAG: type II toxin-antitoxin system death-on-curing family toxin [Clostridiaceae bacterium]|nr:type II toxin-antitoxin system death-on-curing family toxin [Clostridiaceae bacterium]